MKTLTNDVVFQTAKEIIATKGYTTTLDVKNELRNQGYWATQHQVSGILFAEYASNGLDFSQAGDHRQYTEAQAQSAASYPYTATNAPIVGQSKDDAIALCEANGLVYDGTNLRQVQNGTLRFIDPANKENFYTITAKGYARRHIKGYMGNIDMYQLNKQIKTTRTNQYGTFDQIERVLLPGQYVDLAEMVVRIAKKHRS